MRELSFLEKKTTPQKMRVFLRTWRKCKLRKKGSDGADTTLLLRLNREAQGS
jgi:hypothetical protein